MEKSHTETVGTGVRDGVQTSKRKKFNKRKGFCLQRKEAAKPMDTQKIHKCKRDRMQP